MAKGEYRSDEYKPNQSIDKSVVIDLLQQRIKALKQVEHRSVIQEAKAATNELEIRINLMVQHHIYGTINELKLIIKTIESL
ncbi:hypothetical protein [Aureispira anguillae]|uniref:Uncharacterized protein n=1 Tax=Aureispira anguillae TaxID=2864201 RepID=A0A916DTS5_9BACT|nr:hypothetical protein [Aureispira anguillae]BDS12756.1 hypothetical protein AsAng_0034810 [Aureispira anguillae]